MNWKQDYPKMPESFHQALMEEINKNIEQNDKQEKVVSVKRRNWRKWFLISAAAVMAIGGSAMAASRLGLRNVFRQEFASGEAQEMIQTEPQVVLPETLQVSQAVKDQGIESEVAMRPAIPDPSPLLEITEVMFDGAILYVYGDTTENGKNYDMGTDRIYINGQEIGPITSQHLTETITGEAGQDAYIFRADLSELKLTEEFQVILPLSVYKKQKITDMDAAMEAMEAGTYQSPVRYQNQDLEFSVSVNQTSQTVASQTFEHEEYTLEISDIQLSATMIKAKLYYRMTPEQMEAYENGNKWIIYPELEGSSGELYTFQGCMEESPGDGVVLNIEYAGNPLAESSLIVRTQFRSREENAAPVLDTLEDVIVISE